MGKIDILAAEIGSTTTMVNAFDSPGDNPDFLGQGLARTTVEDGDVTIGLRRAVDNLREELDYQDLTWNEFVATSSAAGGLKMTVHGLVKDMTVRAAQEAALGAGAVIEQVTAGKLKDRNLEKVREISPNIILLAGGVDYGEEETVIHNARALAELDKEIPLIYAGNQAVREEVEEIFAPTNFEVLAAENVYPDIDNLNIEPTRKLIHDVFASHIVKAPGMEKIEEWLDLEMMPTPGAVMEAARLLKKEIGNLVVFDVGGATTDIHSVCQESGKVAEMLVSPEPEAKRTVEGDLGVYRNAPYVAELMGDELDSDRDLSPLPRDEEEEELVNRLAREAAERALKRHAGQFRDYYTSGGRQTVAEGKDLTAANWLIGTGGALTRLSRGREILSSLRTKHSRRLLPLPEAKVLLDEDYIMASVGVISQRYPAAALKLLLKSLRLENKNFKNI